MESTVFVDGNNIMGSRPDGWWRDRAKAARRLVAEITPLALGHGGVWTIVFDGRAPPGTEAAPACLTLVHTGHGRRDSADHRIVELVHALPDRARSLVFTSDAKLRARVRALGAQVTGARALLNEIEAVHGALEQSPTGRPFVIADGAGSSKRTDAGLPTTSNDHASRREPLC
ncbi:MAG: NYN domain-containing protein [Boseongicola sp. SB0676_bin_33]|nr:NYN domain-containing protein [Boseongicola sp. SB0676_bin_33]MYK30708.1 NYN domain-containing protein [Boseongicola sp. SB0670_bin_30]